MFFGVWVEARGTTQTQDEHAHSTGKGLTFLWQLEQINTLKVLSCNGNKMDGFELGLYQTCKDNIQLEVTNLKEWGRGEGEAIGSWLQDQR